MLLSNEPAIQMVLIINTIQHRLGIWNGNHNLKVYMVSLYTATRTAGDTLIKVSQCVLQSRLVLKRSVHPNDKKKKKTFSDLTFVVFSSFGVSLPCFWVFCSWDSCLCPNTMEVRGILCAMFTKLTKWPAKCLSRKAVLPSILCWTPNKVGVLTRNRFKGEWMILINTGSDILACSTLYRSSYKDAGSYTSHNATQ